MDDKLLGGVLCVLLLLSFAVQIAGASRAAAAMLSPDPLSVICTSMGGTAHRPVEPDHAVPCPCADLCAAGVHLGATPTPTDASGIPIRFADRIEIAVDHSAPMASRPFGRSYEAQGPPTTST